MMRFAALLCLAAVLACLPAAGAMNMVDGVVATVGREPILRSELIQDAGPALESLRASALSEEEFAREAEKVLRQALEQAIESQILYREAKTAGMEIPDFEIERRVNIIRKKYETNDAFQKAVESSGSTMGDFRERVRRQLMAMSMGMSKRRQYEKEAVVTEEDIAAYFKDHPEEFSHPARARVWRIFISAQKNKESRGEAREKIESVRTEILNGADFAETARAKSEGPEAEEGGLMGWVKKGDLVPELDAALGPLAPNEVSPVVETEFGFHILRVEQREEAGTYSFDQARREIEPLLRGKIGAERYRKWMDGLRKRNSVRIYM